jgi:hypothetical protein
VGAAPTWDGTRDAGDRTKAYLSGRREARYGHCVKSKFITKDSSISQGYGGIFVHLQNKISDYEKRIITLGAGCTLTDGLPTETTD